MAGKVEGEATTDANYHPSSVPLDLLAKVTGQLAALQQANETLVEKWRADADASEKAVEQNVPHGEINMLDLAWVTSKGASLGTLRRTADDLEVATREATA